MSTRKIVTNTIYYGVVPKLTMLLSIVMLPLTTPFLTTYDYGIYGVLTSYTSLFVSIAPLGLNVHLTNSFAEHTAHGAHTTLPARERFLLTRHRTVVEIEVLHENLITQHICITVK